MKKYILVVSHADFRMNDGSKSYNLVDNQSLAANPPTLSVETRRLSGNGPGSSEEGDLNSDKPVPRCP